MADRPSPPPPALMAASAADAHHPVPSFPTPPSTRVAVLNNAYSPTAPSHSHAAPSLTRDTPLSGSTLLLAADKNDDDKDHPEQDGDCPDSEKPKRRTARGKRGGKRHNKARKRAQAQAQAAAASAGLDFDPLAHLLCQGYYYSSGGSSASSSSSVGSLSPTTSLSATSSSRYTSSASSRATTPESIVPPPTRALLHLQQGQAQHRVPVPVVSPSTSLPLWAGKHLHYQGQDHHHHKNVLNAAAMSLGPSSSSPSLSVIGNGNAGHGDPSNLIISVTTRPTASGECRDQSPGPEHVVSSAGNGNGGVSQAHQPEPRVPAGAAAAGKVESFDARLPPHPPQALALEGQEGQHQVGVAANAADLHHRTPDSSPASAAHGHHHHLFIHDPARHSRSPLHLQLDKPTTSDLGHLQWNSPAGSNNTCPFNNNNTTANPAASAHAPAPSPPPLTSRSSTSTLATDSTTGSSAIDQPLPSPSVAFPQGQGSNRYQQQQDPAPPANNPFRAHRPGALDLSAPAFSPLFGFADSPRSASLFAQHEHFSQTYSPTDPRFAKAFQQGYRAHEQDHQAHARQHAAATQEDASPSSASHIFRGQFPYDASMGPSPSSDTDQLVLQNQLYSMEAYQQQTGSATEAYLRQHYQQQQEYDEANKLRAQMSSSPAVYQGVQQQQQQQQPQHQHLGYPGASPQMGPSDAPSPGLGFGHGYYQREAGANGHGGGNTNTRSWSASDEHQYTSSVSVSGAPAPTSRTSSWTMGHERLAVTLPPPSPDHASPAALYARRGVPVPSLRSDNAYTGNGGGEFASYPSVPDRPFPSYLPSLAPSHSPQFQHVRRAPQGKPPKVFVSYLPPVYTVDDVARLFSPYGTIVSIKLLPTPNESLLPLKYRCGFVQFDRDTAVGACIHALHQFHLTLEGKRYILTVRNASDQAPVNNTNLMVKGLPNDMPEQRLFDTFSQFGRVTSCRIMRDRDRTSSDASMHHHQYQPSDAQNGCGRRQPNNKGLAFVNYSTAGDALRAIQNMHNAFIDGRRIHVSFAEKEYPYNVHVFDNDPGPEVAALQSGTPLPAKTTLPPPPTQQQLQHTPTTPLSGMAPSPTLGHYAQARANVYSPSEFGYLEATAGAGQYPTPEGASLRRDRGAEAAFGYLDQHQQQYSPMPEFRTVVVVMGIPLGADESHVEAEHARYGDVFQVRLFRGGMGPESTQIAIVAFTHPSAALRAVQSRPHSTALANDSFANTVATYSDMCAAGLTTPDPSPQLAQRTRAGLPPASSDYRPGYLGTTSPSLGAGATAFAGRQPQPSPPLGFTQLGSSLTGLPSPTVHLGAGTSRAGVAAVGRARTYSSASSGSYSWSPALGQHASGVANSYGSSVSEQQQVAAAAAAAGSDIYDSHHHGQAAGSFAHMYSVNGNHSHGSSSSPTSSGSPTAHGHDLSLSRSFADLALDASEPRRVKGGFMHQQLGQVRAHETGGADDESSIAPPAHVVSGVLTLVDQE